MLEIKYNLMNLWQFYESFYVIVRGIHHKNNIMHICNSGKCINKAHKFLLCGVIDLLEQFQNY